MQCVQCGISHDRKGIYCSKSCTDKAYRQRKKLKLIKPAEVEDVEIDDNITIPKETGIKQKWCNFCGGSLDNSIKLGFCDNHHELEYWKAVHRNLPLKIRIDPKTVVETRRYHKVQEIIEAMINRNKLGATFF